VTTHKPSGAVIASHGLLNTIAQKRTDNIIDKLVTAYRAGTLTNEEMRGAIGEIAAYRALGSELTNEIRELMKEEG